MGMYYTHDDDYNIQWEFKMKIFQTMKTKIIIFNCEKKTGLTLCSTRKIICNQNDDDNDYRFFWNICLIDLRYQNSTSLQINE